LTHRSHLLLLVLALLTLPCAVPALAQAPPRSIQLTTIATTSPLNGEQKEELESFAEYYLSQLAAQPDKADEVAAARDKLLEPLKGPAVTPVFRNAYSQVLEPRLREILEQADSTDGYNANNAAQVLGMLGTNDAARTLMNHVSVDDEKRVSVRIIAAHSLSLALQQGDLAGGVPLQSVRKLADAAQVETNWTALNRQFIALDEIAETKPGLDANARLIESLNKTTDRIKADVRDSDLMEAVYQALPRFRDAILRNMTPAERADIAPKIGDTTTRVFAVAQARWNDAQADPDTKMLYGGTILFAEQFLPIVRSEFMGKKDSPASGAKAAWDKGDRAAFDAVAARWNALFPPR
jgi:hypothetical protein